MANGAIIYKAESEYDNNLIAPLKLGDVVIIRCKKKVMNNDIVVCAPTATVAKLLEKVVTENGTYTPPEGFNGFSKVTVSVIHQEPTSEKLVVTPDTMLQVITPANADYFSEVTVEPIPDEYEIPVIFDGQVVVE